MGSIVTRRDQAEAKHSSVLAPAAPAAARSGNVGETVQRRNVPVAIEGLSGPQHLVHLEQDRNAYVQPRHVIAEAALDEPLEGEPDFRRIVVAQLVLDDFQDRRLYRGIASWP